MDRVTDAEVADVDLDRVRDLGRQALELDASNRLARQELGRELVRAGDLVQAQALWRSAGEQAKDARELCLALCAQAELAAQSGADPQLVDELLRRALHERRRRLSACQSLQCTYP